MWVRIIYSHIYQTFKYRILRNRDYSLIQNTLKHGILWKIEYLKYTSNTLLHSTRKYWILRNVEYVEKYDTLKHRILKNTEYSQILIHTLKWASDWWVAHPDVVNVQVVDPLGGQDPFDEIRRRVIGELVGVAGAPPDPSRERPRQPVQLDCWVSLSGHKPSNGCHKHQQCTGNKYNDLSLLNHTTVYAKFLYERGNGHSFLVSVDSAAQWAIISYSLPAQNAATRMNFHIKVFTGQRKIRLR